MVSYHGALGGDTLVGTYEYLISVISELAQELERSGTDK